MYRILFRRQNYSPKDDRISFCRQNKFCPCTEFYSVDKIIVRAQNYISKDDRISFRRHLATLVANCYTILFGTANTVRPPKKSGTGTHRATHNYEQEVFEI